MRNPARSRPAAPGRAVALALGLIFVMAACAAPATESDETASAAQTATAVQTPEPDPTEAAATPISTPEPTPDPTSSLVIGASVDELVAGAIAFFEDLELTCLEPAGDDGQTYCVAGETCELALMGEPAIWGCTVEYPAGGGIYANFIGQDLGAGPSLSFTLEFVGEGDLPDWARDVMTATVSRVCGVSADEAESVVDETFSAPESAGCTNREPGAQATLSGFPPSEETPPHWWMGGYANFVLATSGP